MVRMASRWEGPWTNLFPPGFRHLDEPSNTGAGPSNVDFSGRTLMIGAFNNILDESYTWWEEGWPEEVAGPDLLSDRQVTSIARNPVTGNLLAGLDAGIVRSEPDGENWDYVVKYTGRYYHPDGPDPPIGIAPDDPSIRPYVRHFLFLKRNAQLVLAAGHEGFAGRKPAVPYFAISRDDGRTWENRTDLVREIAPDVVSPIVFLEEGPSEKIYMGIASKSDRELFLVEVKLPDPAADALGGEYRGNGWRESQAFGLLYTRRFPWVWSNEHKVWWHAVETDAGGDSLWLHDPELGWLWTSRITYPFFYCPDKVANLYYRLGTAEPRWFWNVLRKQWIRVPEA